MKEFVLPTNESVLPPTLDDPQAAPAVIVTEATSERNGVLVGPFTFDFDLPLSPGHTVEVQQIAETAGVALELKRVLVTPSETRALLCIEAPGDEWEHSCTMTPL